jgi:hypothetical protein
MGMPAGRQLDGTAGREAGTDERVESGLTTFLTNRLTAFFGECAHSLAGQQVAIPFSCILFSLIFGHNRLVYIENYQINFILDLFIPKNF